MKEIICVECSKMFELSDDQIRWFEERNMTNPKRCKSCRQVRKTHGDTEFRVRKNPYRTYYLKDLIT